MEKIKLTKTQLKKEKDSLKRYNRYLPILFIKKQQLRKEIGRIDTELKKIDGEFNGLWDDITPWVGLLGEEVEISHLIKLINIETERGNIAGVDIPIFINAHIDTKQYDLFLYPLWVDRALDLLRTLLFLRAKQTALKYQKLCLIKELQVTSQRVNLFEQIKIPGAKEAVRRISIYLGDQQAQEIGWARIAKKKIQKAG